MTPERLMVAAEVLGWMADGFQRLVDDQRDAVIASLSCSTAQLLCLELAKNLSDEVDPYEAFIATARGEMGLTRQQQTLASMLMPRNEK